MRRFDLVTVDLNGTLLPETTAFELLLRAAGEHEEADRLRAMQRAGRIGSEEAFLARWGLVRRMTMQEMHRHLRRSDAWLPRIGEGVRKLRGAGLDVWLLTDQPSTVTDFLMRWGFQRAVCSPVEVVEGRQETLEPRMDKLANLEAALGEDGGRLDRVCHVGDGGNDVPVFRAVAASVAVRPRAGVGEAATHVLPAPADFGEVVDAVLALCGA